MALWQTDRKSYYGLSNSAIFIITLTCDFHFFPLRQDSLGYFPDIGVCCCSQIVAYSQSEQMMSVLSHYSSLKGPLRYVYGT